MGCLRLCQEHATLPTKVVCSPSAVVYCIVTPVPHCPLMATLVGAFEAPQGLTSSVPAAVNELPLICKPFKVHTCNYSEITSNHDCIIKSSHDRFVQFVGMYDDFNQSKSKR
jgi:hypothetical protein